MAAGLSTEALKVLKAYQRMDVEAIAGLRLPPAVEREVEDRLGTFVRHVMERDVRSRRFLEEVKAGYGEPTVASAAARPADPRVALAAVGPSPSGRSR
jgi:hypothetical protein